MIAGIYSANFISNNNLAGSGIVVIDGATLHGGDSNYLYKGKYRLDDSKIIATVEIENYTGQPNSILGPLLFYRLTLTGVISPKGFNLSGSVERQSSLMIRIELKKIGELVDQ